MTDDDSTALPPRRVTLSDIAKAAGVSRATVSLVMRDSPTIPKRTHQLVQHHAKELGYVYNRAAANLRTSSTRLVALAVHDITNPYFSEIVAVMQTELAANDYVVVLGNTQDSPEIQDQFVRTVREYNVSGLIMSPAAETTSDWMRALCDWRLPSVLFSRFLPDVPMDYIGGSNWRGVYETTSHLIELGHERIAFIAANESFSSGRERLEGYCSALENAGIEVDPSLIVRCPATRIDAHDALLRLLGRADAPTATCCFNDVVAFGAILALHNLGLRVAEDFSVTGYDDVAEATVWRPALTTQRVPVAEIGREAVKLLIRRMANVAAPFETMILPSDLRVRGTTGAPPDAARRAEIREIALNF